MALPIILASVAAVVLMSSGKRRGKSKRADNGSNGPLSSGSIIPKFTLVTVKKSKIGEPWSYCQAPEGSPKGTFAALDSSGNSCMVFWRPETNGIVLDYIKNQLSKLPKSERDSLCAVDECIPDPFAPDPLAFCNSVTNPKVDIFLKTVAMSLFPQIPGNYFPLPMADNLGNVNSPHFIKMVWSLIASIFYREICGFNKVT